jgi:hypothetical protein
VVLFGYGGRAAGLVYGPVQSGKREVVDGLDTLEEVVESGVYETVEKVDDEDKGMGHEGEEIGVDNLEMSDEDEAVVVVLLVSEVILLEEY